MTIREAMTVSAREQWFPDFAIEFAFEHADGADSRMAEKSNKVIPPGLERIIIEELKSGKLDEVLKLSCE